MAEYKNFGLQYVHPDLIRIDPPLDDDWETTKDGGGGTRREDINACIDHLPEVRSAIDAGRTADDFQRLGESDAPHERALSDAYGMFYEHPIKVNRDGDEFVIGADGRHRTYLLQQRGESLTPAEVHAPADDPEFAARPFDAARRPAPEQLRQENHMSGERHGYVPDEYKTEAPEVYRNPDVRNVDGHLPHERAEAQGQNQPTDAQAQPLADAAPTKQADAPALETANASRTHADPLSGDSARDPMDGREAVEVTPERDLPETFEAPAGLG
jgi:hypothetical protein